MQVGSGGVLANFMAEVQGSRAGCPCAFSTKPALPNNHYMTANISWTNTYKRFSTSRITAGGLFSTTDTLCDFLRLLFLRPIRSRSCRQASPLLSEIVDERTKNTIGLVPCACRDDVIQNPREGHRHSWRITEAKRKNKTRQPKSFSERIGLGIERVNLVSQFDKRKNRTTILYANHFCGKRFGDCFLASYSWLNPTRQCLRE